MNASILRTALAVLLLLAAAPARAETLTLRDGGEARRVELLLPSIPPGRPLPLLILLHGRFGTGAQVLGDSGLRPGNFILAAPDGYRRSWASGRGMTPADQAGVDDIAFLRALIDEMVQRHGADPARVYVAGMSNGGFMAARLACEAPDLVAAIAIVSATTGQAAAAGCRGSRPVSVLLIHGTADRIIGADGTAPRQVGPIMGAGDAARFWARQEGCAAPVAPRPLPHAGPPDGTAAWRTDFAPCRGGARVSFIEIRGGGHAWPGGQGRLPERLVGPTSRAIDAAAEILGFFGLGRN